MAIFEKIENENLGKQFHFEYSIETQGYRLEGREYVGFGVSAKMVDKHGIEEAASVRDVTSEYETACSLLRSLNSSKVSPMCLKMFVLDFLVNA